MALLNTNVDVFINHPENDQAKVKVNYIEIHYQSVDKRRVAITGKLMIDNPLFVESEENVQPKYILGHFPLILQFGVHEIDSESETFLREQHVIALSQLPEGFQIVDLKK